MNLEAIKDRVRHFPKKPGVYLMQDRSEKVLYVGKAVDLRSRVMSYFAKEDPSRYQVKFLMSKVHDIEIVVTDTAKEALLLENTLIKKHRPRYNIDLKDDKSYLSLKLSINHKAPRLYPTRRIKKDGGIYYGPYTSAGACREVVDFIERHFRLRTCSDHEYRNRSRPCLQYEIKRCDAPCVGLISLEDYGAMVEQVRWFLEGKGKKIKAIAEQKMNSAAATEQFEEAARYRDLLIDIEKTLEKQKVVSHEALNRDVLGMYREGELVQIFLLKIREGTLSQHRAYFFKSIMGTEETLSSFIIQYYDAGHKIPSELVLPVALPDAAIYEEVLKDLANQRVRLQVPRRGEKLDLLRLAEKNATETFRTQQGKDQERKNVMIRLAERLALQNFPERIECYDISHFQGGQTIGSMVVFWQGEPLRKFYRRFNIQSVSGPDDFASLYEMLFRRLKRSLSTSGEKESAPWALPDLLLIDGGKGQLNAAQQALKDLRLTGIDLVAIAKSRLAPSAGPGQDLSQRTRSEERLFVPGRKNPIFLRAHSNELFLLMQARDEAHRFGIEAHRKARNQKSLNSGLKQIPGVGPVRSQRLLQYFGSYERLQKASAEEVARALGSSLPVAQRIIDHF